MTSSGYKKLQNELKFLVNKERPKIISAIAEARQVTRKIDNPAEQLTALTILLDAQNDLKNIATRKQTLHHIFEIIDLTEDIENKIWALTVAAIASSGSE